MSTAAIKAWGAVTRQQIDDALARLHAADRPSYAAVVAVGRELSVFTNAKKGYCDLTIGQFYDRLKGAYGVSVIRNALWALQVAGIVANLNGGTRGKDGKGRGAHRVFLDADTNDLIPPDYVPPSPRRDPDTGHDLSQTFMESDTGRRESGTGHDESDTGHDLSTLKESLSSSTAAPAGRRTTEDSLGQVDAQDSEWPSPVAALPCTPIDTERRDRLARAAIADEKVTAGLSPEGRHTLKKNVTPYAAHLLTLIPDRADKELAEAMKVIASSHRKGRLIGPDRFRRVEEIARATLDATP